MGMMISTLTFFWRFLGVVVLPCVSRTMASHAPCCCRPGAAGASDHLRGIGTAVVREIPGGISCWEVSGEFEVMGKPYGKPKLLQLRSFGKGSSGWFFEGFNHCSEAVENGTF